MIAERFGTYEQVAEMHSMLAEYHRELAKGCGIRGKAATDSDGRRPSIPIESDHPIRRRRPPC